MSSFQAPCWHVVWTDFHMNFILCNMEKGKEQGWAPEDTFLCQLALKLNDGQTRNLRCVSDAHLLF